MSVIDNNIQHWHRPNIQLSHQELMIDIEAKGRGQININILSKLYY